MEPLGLIGTITVRVSVIYRDRPAILNGLLVVVVSLTKEVIFNVGVSLDFPFLVVSLIVTDRLVLFQFSSLISTGL